MERRRLDIITPMIFDDVIVDRMIILLGLSAIPPILFDIIGWNRVARFTRKYVPSLRKSRQRRDRDYEYLKKRADIKLKMDGAVMDDGHTGALICSDFEERRRQSQLLYEHEHTCPTSMLIVQPIATAFGFVGFFLGMMILFIIPIGVIVLCMHVLPFWLCIVLGAFAYILAGVCISRWVIDSTLFDHFETSDHFGASVLYWLRLSLYYCTVWALRQYCRHKYIKNLTNAFRGLCILIALALAYIKTLN